MYYGSWKPDDFITFFASTTDPSSGAAADATGSPAYEIYEDETGTPVASGSMAKINDAGTVGLYSERVELVSATFDKGKSYHILIEATVAGVAAQTIHNFQIEAEVDANTFSAPSSSASDIASTMLELMTLTNGTAAAAAAGTLTLDGTGSTVDDYYNSAWIFISSGTGAGQSRLIDDYVGSTKVVTVSPNWATTPSTDSIYWVFPNGNVQGGSAPTAAAIADAVWDETAADHNTVSSMGEAMNDAGTGANASQIADAVWDENLAAHLTAGSAGESLDNAGSAASASSIADAVWDEVLAGAHDTATSAGKLVQDASTFDASTDSVDLNADQSGVTIGTVNSLATAAYNAISENLLKYDLSTITGEATRSVLNAVRVLRNRVNINKNTGLVTVYKEDDSTTAWTANATLESRNPIGDIDPT